MRKLLRPYLVTLFGGMVAITTSSASAQDVEVDAGYVDYFELTDGRTLDMGQLGGGLPDGSHKLDVLPQSFPRPPGVTQDGRLTGVVHAKFRVVNFTDRNGDGFINGTDLDQAFDVAWQLVGFDKTQGPSSAFFVSSVMTGPEGTNTTYPSPYISINQPPTAGGTASVWNVAACTTPGGSTLHPNYTAQAAEFCDAFAIPSPGPNAPFTGFVDYTFRVSIPGINDFTPGPTIAANTAWVLAALVGNTASASPPGAVSFGFNAFFNPVVAANESGQDQFGAVFRLAGSQANVASANLLTTIQINVIPEPGVLGLLAAGALLVVGSRRRK